MLVAAPWLWMCEGNLGEEHREGTDPEEASGGQTAGSWRTPVLAYFYFWKGWQD